MFKARNNAVRPVVEFSVSTSSVSPLKFRVAAHVSGRVYDSTDELAKETATESNAVISY
jgi:hypothetical protein